MFYKSFKFKEADLGVFSKNTSELKPLLKNDCRILGLTNGRFSLIDLINEITKYTGRSHVICATWSAGIKDANQIKWLMNNDRLFSFKLITDRSYKTRQKSYCISIEELFGIDNIRTSDIHAKFVLIHNDQYNFVIRSSMNLNANKTCETFEIDESKDIFDFYMNFVKHTYGTMPKGFTEDRFIVSQSINKYFGIKDEKENFDINLNFDFNF
jgi:hypothetical protein